MDNNGSWRDQLGQGARDQMINEIQENLEKCLPSTDPEGLNQLKKIAVRFEEKIYQAASSQVDYRSKISAKMLEVERRSGTELLDIIRRFNDL